MRKEKQHEWVSEKITLLLFLGEIQARSLTSARLMFLACLSLLLFNNTITVRMKAAFKELSRCCKKKKIAYHASCHELLRRRFYWNIPLWCEYGSSDKRFMHECVGEFRLRVVKAQRETLSHHSSRVPRSIVSAGYPLGPFGFQSILKNIPVGRLVISKMPSGMNELASYLGHIPASYLVFPGYRRSISTRT